MSPLARYLARSQLEGALPEGIDALCDAIEARHGEAVVGMALYGSCRRQTGLQDGLADLLVIVDRYRPALGSSTAALANYLLPPNVYYLQADQAGKTVRCKYAVVRLDQLERRMNSRLDHYFWARFGQPMRWLGGQDSARERLAALRARALEHFAARIRPLQPRPLTAIDFWTLALNQTYRCELRPEPEHAARRLIEHDLAYWTTVSEHLETGRQASASSGHRLITRLAWTLRRPAGKLTNLARLFKAAGTFSNGVDYLVWKVERHSGVRVEPTERMRRHPRLAIWSLAWQMWRQGGFR